MEILKIENDGTKTVITTSLGDIDLPRCVRLRPTVVAGNKLDPYSQLGDFEVPTDAKFGENVQEDFYEVLGDYAADWILRAIWQQSTIRHSMAGVDLVCYPHILVPNSGAKASQKFIDMREELGREYVDFSDPDHQLVKLEENEARLHVFHMRQSVSAEALQLSGNGFRADLYSIRPYWEKHFRAGKAPFNGGKNYKQQRSAA